MTKEQLLKLGINTDKDLTDDEIFEMLSKKSSEKDAELKKHKDLLSTRNGEIAEYKRKEQEKLSEEEKIKLHYEDLEKQNAQLNRRLTIADKVAEYVGIGYSDELAKKIAEAEVDGKSTIEYRKQFLKEREETYKAELLKQGSNPTIDTSTKTITKEDFAKMNYQELLDLQAKNPTLYEELSKK